MKSAVPLYEFMPYGAPELIESRRAHMTRALALASLLAVALFAATGRLASLMHAPAIEPIPRIVDFSPDFVPPAFVPPSPPAAPSRPRFKADVGVPLPVPDAKAPPEASVSTHADVTGVTTEGGEHVVGVPPSPAVEPARPGVNDYVYVDELPVAIREVVPEYPEIARQAGVEGLVMVKALVGKDGRVLDVWLDPKHEIPMLNGAALEAARRCVFKPAYANGHPVVVWTAIPFHFRLY